MKEGEEIESHIFKENPFLLLEKYPGIKQLLEQRVEKSKDVLGWREFEGLIQCDGWSCNITFHWRYSKKNFHVEAVRLFKICRAPDEKDQMELLT